ncbi:MAG: WD40 repeat domain-containing protein [Chloroflexota bacterium]
MCNPFSIPHIMGEAWPRPYIIAVVLLTLMLASGIHAQDAPVTITTDNADALELIYTLEGHTLRVNDLVFAPDGATLISGSDDITARTWDMATGETIWEMNGQLNLVRSVDISPDGRAILTTGFDNYAFRWDVRSRTRADEVQELAAFNDGEYAPDGTTFALSVGDGTVRIYDSATNAQLLSIQAPALRVPRLSYHPDGTQIAGGTGFPDNRVLVWDVDSGEIAHEYDFFDDTILSLDYRADGEQLAAATANGDVVVIDVLSGEPQYTVALDAGGVFDVAYNPTSHLLAAVDFAGGVYVWNSDDGEQLAHLLPDVPMTAVAFSPDGASLATGGNDTRVYVWQAGE